MADPLTTNKSLIQMATGTASGTWGAVLNAQMIAPIDSSLGNTVSVPVSSSDVNLTTTQIQNLAFNLTGTLTGNINITLPLAANSTSQAVGGFFVVDNEATGAFGVTVKTVATGSLGVQAPYGVRSLVYSDGINVGFADDAQNRTLTVSGNPNGSVAGTAGSASTRASRVIDRTTNIEYLATTSGTASSTVWSVNLPFTFAPQGYLTASSDATNPVLTGDSIGATTIYYTAFRGNLVFLYNGVSFAPAPITGGQMSLALSSSAQGASGIYDVLAFIDSGGTLRVGFSPAWTTATAGSGSRGTGAGTPQLTRINGILVNAVSQTVNNGATTYAVAANRGTYLGSVSVDATPGQVTCHRSYGQSRKFGIWNAYNRLPIYLRAGDNTSSWQYTTSTIRPANNSTANSLTVFCGLPEELANLEYQIKTNNGNANNQITFGIGWNSTTAISGTNGAGSGYTNNVVLPSSVAAYFATPFLGVNVATALEQSTTSLGTTSWYGTETNMLLSAAWNG